ncbi:SymE family type I addiction module toxin [Jejubacter calystegiae]|nr:SymE family type I addiction module toxin [Jejubacter calystegiae]
MHLKGRRLSEAGFEIGCPVKMTIESGRIIICPG